MRHTGTVPFVTRRLICRPFQREDLTAMFQGWLADPGVQLEYGEPVYPTLSQAESLLASYLEGYSRKDFYRWAILPKDQAAPIGMTAFCRVYDDCRTAEIEYCLGRAFWGQGYAGEALAGLVDFAFTHTDFQKLEAYHRAENRRSGKVLERSPLSVTSSVERFIRENHAPQGKVCYCVFKEEYLRRP